MGRKRKQSERWMLNKKAFDEVIGDPYALPEPIEGHYATLKNRSSIIIGEPEQKSSSPVNQARPNVVDFTIDVENGIKDGLELYAKEFLFELPDVFDTFITTYITEGPKEECFNQRERADVEQIIGRILVTRSIYPTAKYFTTIRK